jgi:Sec7-like guanine-nucleotide exchange factor
MPIATLQIFSTEELEIILENFCDLLSDSSFLPSLFASFDCDPTRIDIVQPIVQCICHVARYILIVRLDLSFHDLNIRIVLNSASEELGLLKELGVLHVQAYKQILKSFSHRQMESINSANNFEIGNDNNSADEKTNAEKKNYLPSLLRGARLTKFFLREASAKFEEKPELGLRYLQQNNALPTPLTPISVAKFLRLAPDLSKENVGSYLGELGKDSPKYEADSKSFHTEVLLKYVDSFALSGQTILNCMRIFLSAFRLPGEAQQIDRILVAFSEYCHSCSIEGQNGLVENPEVTYLLTFSIIMLNTDRHNPNIRADRRMTLEQFIRNNTNYGKDVNQTKPLTREYLEDIFNSISEFPIRTESNGLKATVTSEVWMDLQLQAQADPKKAMLRISNHNLKFLKRLSKFHEQDILSLDYDINFKLYSTLTPSHIASLLFTGEMKSYPKLQLLISPLNFSMEMNGLNWIADCDMIECIWKDLLVVCISVQMSNYRANFCQSSSFSNSTDHKKKKSWHKERIGRSFQISNEFLFDLVEISKFFHLNYVLDMVLLLTVEFSGMTKIEVCFKKHLFLLLIIIFRATLLNTYSRYWT